MVVRALLAHHLLQISRSPHRCVPRGFPLSTSTWILDVARTETRCVSRGDRQKVGALDVSSSLELMFDRLGHCARWVEWIDLFLSLVLLLSHGALDWTEQTLETIST